MKKDMLREAAPSQSRDVEQRPDPVGRPSGRRADQEHAQAAKQSSFAGEETQGRADDE
jgi:hypothetical protein